MNTKKHKQLKKALRVRATISGSSVRPRLSVHKTSKHIYGQFIDDSKGITLGSFSSALLESSDKKSKTKIEEASAVGAELVKVAKKIKINSIVFDRGRNKYHGRVKALADAVRKGEIKF